MFVFFPISTVREIIIQIFPAYFFDATCCSPCGYGLFFAAIEQRENSELQGKAILVCMLSGRSGLSGAVSMCNYTAREFGVRAGMSRLKAKQLNPDAVFWPVRKDFYNSVSDRFMEILRSYADARQIGDIFEQISIDEAFLEITEKTGADEQGIFKDEISTS